MSLCLVGCHLFALPSEVVCRADDPCADCDSDYAQNVENVACEKASRDFAANSDYNDECDAANAALDLVLNDPNSTTLQKADAAIVCVARIAQAALSLQAALWASEDVAREAMVAAWEAWEACMQAGGC